MQLTTAQLMATPCDDEEDNMATLCCISDKGEMFLMTRYPDEDGLKITLGPKRLLIEVAPGDADALGGDDHLEITHSTPDSDLAEVEETLQNILKGTGTYVSEL